MWKKFLESLIVSTTFRTYRENGPQIGKNYAYCKETAMLLVFHFRWIFIDIFGRITCNEEEEVIDHCFFYRFSSEIDIFVKYSENWYFSHFLTDGPVKCYFEKAILIKKTFEIRCFGWKKGFMWYYKTIGNVIWKKAFLVGAPLCTSLIISGSKNSVLIGLIDK